MVADTYGDLYGSFFFEDPLKTPAPSLRFKVGTSTFKLSSESTVNTAIAEGSILLSEAGTEYITNGKVNTIQSTNITVRVPPPVFYLSLIHI